MYIKTPFAGDIENAGQKANYDASAKRLLADKQILAWILKCCMPEFADTDVKEIADRYIIGEPQISRVQGIGVEDVTITEGTVTFDIRFQAVVPRTQKPVSLIINIEAQNNFYPGYPLTKRGIYYCGRMLSSQYGTVFTQSHYEKLKKVYSIWICASPPAYRANTVTTYSIAEKNILGSFREKKKNYDLLTMVMICLGKTASMEHKDNRAETILRLLDVLLSSDLTAKNKMCILEQEFSIPMTEKFRKKVRLKNAYSAEVLNLPA